jgi:hypothetical protein
MATKTTVLVCRVSDVKDHSNADKLQVCNVLGWQMVIPKGQFKDGDKVVYFPPDTLLPDVWAEKWNVKNYLKGVNKDRIGKVRLRGEPSFGLAVKPCEDWEEGTNVAEYFGATKYEPPVRPDVGDEAPFHPLFYSYTDIENLRNFPDVFNEGEEVVATEKLHGTNCRVSLIEGKFMAGSMILNRAWPYQYIKKVVIDPVVVEKLGQSNIDLCPPTLTVHNIPREVKDIMKEKELTREDLYVKDEAGSLGDTIVKFNPYWFPLTIPNVRELVLNIGGGYQIGFESVIVFGEVYGGSIQNLNYGIPSGKGFGFRIFDIQLNGKFMNHDDLVQTCQKFGVDMVPVLYRGPFSLNKIKEVSGGNTTMGNQDHIREGVVVRPVVERTHPRVGRLVMKYISDQYLMSDSVSDYKDI